MRTLIIVFIVVLAIISIQASFRREEPASKAALGRMLFFDRILSKDKTISCSSCHLPAYAFADTLAVSSGVGGRKGVRNTPSAMNMSLQSSFFWDGRAKSLEDQVLGPIENAVEMNLPIDEALLRLRNNRRYRRYFKTAFDSDPTRSNLAEAISAFERTLETSDSPFDNWKFSDDAGAVTESVKRGFALFSEKAKCSECHFGADFTTNEFRNIGLFNGRELNDSGRGVVSGTIAEVGKFKTPSLRNVAVTAPYMHNGMFKTLGEVIDFYNDPDSFVANAINRDSLLAKPLGLTPEEKIDLKAFLMSLTDKRFSSVNRVGNGP